LLNVYLGLDNIKPPFSKKKEVLTQPLTDRKSLGSLEKDEEAAANSRPVQGMLFGQFLQQFTWFQLKLSMCMDVEISIQLF